MDKRARLMLLRSAVVASVAVLGACAVGPDYQQPETVGGTPVDARFANAATLGMAEGAVTQNFWSAFGDAQLDQLVKDALAENKNLQIAAANLRAARAASRLSGHDLYPTVTAGAGYSRTLASQDQAPGLDRDAREANVAEAGFDALWELDLFGRVRRGVEAARADADASLAELHDAQVSVSAEVARNYFVLRGLQDQLALTARNAENQGQSFKVTLARLDAGRGNQLDTARAEAQMRTTLANIPTLEAAIARTIYRLSVLTGRQPAALVAQLDTPEAMPDLPALNDIGTPEALLRRRPDIRAAERSLAGATARIGVAVGDLFPKVSFVGSVGYSASSFGRFGTDALTYGYGPSLSWAAFDLGRVRHRIDIAKAGTEASLANYEAVVLGALEETEGALITYGRAQNRRDTLAEAVAASDKAAALARQRFEGGLTDFFTVLDAERSALDAETLLSQSRTDAATSLIAVYKALGGGWIGDQR